MKLDANALRYLLRDDWRVLTAVELGQKNVRTVAAADLIHESVLIPDRCVRCSMKSSRHR